MCLRERLHNPLWLQSPSDRGSKIFIPDPSGLMMWVSVELLTVPREFILYAGKSQFTGAISLSSEERRKQRIGFTWLAGCHHGWLWTLFNCKSHTTVWDSLRFPWVEEQWCVPQYQPRWREWSCPSYQVCVCGHTVWEIRRSVYEWLFFVFMREMVLKEILNLDKYNICIEFVFWAVPQCVQHILYIYKSVCLYCRIWMELCTGVSWIVLV